MTTVQDPTVQRRRLRVELRRAREAAGMRQTDVAHAMEWSPSKLVRIERGDVSVSANNLRALLTHYGVRDDKRVNELLELARTTRGSSLYDQYADLLKPEFKEYLAYEASAFIIRQYDLVLVLVSELIQTEEYSRAILGNMAGFDSDDVNRAWTVRQHRQDVVEGPGAPEMFYVLDEAALRRHVDRGQVIRHQLEGARALASETHIHIQVIPFIRGAHRGMAGNFILLEFADSNPGDLVYLQSINQITIRDDTELISQHLDKLMQLEKLELIDDKNVYFIDRPIRYILTCPATKEAA